MSDPIAHGHAHPHGHSWHLPDGTGLHAEPGRLTRDRQTGELCCHVCGEYFTSLGGHVRVHGYSAETYRAAMGLGRTTPLVAAGFSQTMGDRQRRRYQDSTACRAVLAEGHELARRVELNRLARAAESRRRADDAAARRTRRTRPSPHTSGTAMRQERAWRSLRAPPDSAGSRYARR